MRRLELIVNMLLVFGPPAIAIVGLVILTPVLTIFISLVCFLVGIALLAYAKVGLFQRGIWVSFGTGQMHATGRRAYWQGYGFIAIGVALNLITQLVLFGSR